MQETLSIHIQDLAKEAEIELVASARENPLAFRRLYEQHARQIYRYLYSTTGSIADAEDLTSQVFLQAMEDLGKFRNQGDFRTWLFTIARSRAIDHFRKRKTEIPLDETNLHAHEADPLSEVIRRNQVDLMRSNINALHENDKDLIRLRYVSGLSFAEIGKVLNRSEGAVKKRLYRLIARLSDQMEIDHE